MARRGRPSRQDDNERRAALVGQLVSAMGSLHHLSQLSESPLCQLPEVVRGARESRVAYYPRAATLASAVRAVHGLALEELAGTPDELPIQALGDALAGRSRADTAARLGVGLTYVSTLRREAAEIVIDQLMARLSGDLPVHER